MSRAWRLAIPIVCLAVVGWLVFGGLSTAHFVAWDDPDFVVTDPWLNPPSWSNLAQSWTRPRLELYTPVLYTAWSAIAALEHRPPDHPLIAGPFHVFNISVHIIAAIAAFLLLNEFFSAAAATAGAMLFLLHPMQVDPVAWVSGAKDLLCGAFSLLALWQYVRFAKSLRQGRTHFAAATVLFALALLSKPTAVVVPLVAAVLDYWLVKRPPRAIGKSLSIWAIMAAITAIAARAFQTGTLLHPLPLWARPLIAVDTIGYYAFKLIAPFDLTIDYERMPNWVLSHPAAAWPGLIVLTAVALIYFTSRGRQILIPLLVALIPLLPVLGLTVFDFQDYSTPADRYMYLPMFGIAMLATMFLERAGGMVPWALTGAGLLLLAVLSFNQTLVWHDTDSLIRRQLAFDPDSSTGHGIQASWLVALGKDDEALKEFRVAIADLARENKIGAPAFWQSYGNLLWRSGRPDEAIAAYQTALPQMPPDKRCMALDNLGMAYLVTGNSTTARQEFEEALRIAPDDAIARRNLDKLGRN